MKNQTVTERIEDYLARMEGKISRKAHLVRIFLNENNYVEFKEELRRSWMMSSSLHAVSAGRDMYLFMGYLVEVIRAVEESIVIELKDEYKAAIQGNH